jgi:hypothetical protein
MAASAAKGEANVSGDPGKLPGGPYGDENLLQILSKGEATVSGGASDGFGSRAGASNPPSAVSKVDRSDGKDTSGVVKTP